MCSGDRAVCISRSRRDLLKRRYFVFRALRVRPPGSSITTTGLVLSPSVGPTPATYLSVPLYIYG